MRNLHADVAQLVERELPKLRLNENRGERRLNRPIGIWLARAVSTFRLRSRFSLGSFPFAWIIVAAVGFLLGPPAFTRKQKRAARVVKVSASRLLRVSPETLETTDAADQPDCWLDRRLVGPDKIGLEQAFERSELTLTVPDRYVST
jgi:hypothetical protein